MSKQWPQIAGETDIDPSGLKDKSIMTRAQLIPVEFANIAFAIEKYLAAPPSKQQAPFTVAWFLKLHKEMYGRVWDWAGQPRTRQLSIGVDPALVGQELGGLSLRIEAFENVDSLLLEQSVIIHHEGVRIHPFKDGNGRWSRLLANIWLRQHGKPVIEWPDADLGSQASEIHGEYLRAVQAADNHNYDLLTELHERYWPKN